MATWRLMGCYLGELGEWFILGVGSTKEVAKLVGEKHAAHLESEGPDEDLVPREIPWTRMERWYWGEWEVFIDNRNLPAATSSLENVLSGINGMSVHADYGVEEIVVSVNEDATENDVNQLKRIAMKGWERFKVRLEGVV
jgi:hypothetical protein